ncbi:MAG: acetolactate synthase large subunit [Pseudomonadota bacterium]|nr:acetolactate synthase large subunit [Pseudomonadota bacterium]
MKITGAEALVKSLLHVGVKTIFGYPGGAIMPTYDALFNEPLLRHILVRHEQGAAIAAEGYARLSGTVGVCVATSGPGATNLITGIADAMLDSIPIVCITGQVHSALIGTDAFQEADIMGMTVPVTKWNYQVNNASEIPYIIAKAFHVAKSGRPGPVLIDITKDAQQGVIEFDVLQMAEFVNAAASTAAHIPQVPDLKFENAAHLINNAKKPYIFAGHGITIAGAEEELVRFANKTGIPVACTLHGLSVIAMDHPLYVGMLGMHGNYGSNVLTNEADLIIAIGMRFDDRVTGNLASYAKQAKVIHIDIDIAELNKNVKADVGICGDAKQVLTELYRHVLPNNHDAWIGQFKDYYKLEHDTVIHHQVTNQPGHMIKMAEVIALLSKKTNGEAVIVSDVGQHQMISARYYQFKRPNSHITSGGLGTMGYALPAAIGAKVAAPSREVIAIIGDGGFQMNIQELAVLTQENLTLKIIILNNEYLGMVRQWQELFFDRRYSFTNLVNPDFIKIAEAYSIRGVRVQDESELEEAIDKLLNSTTSFLLEVMVEKQGKVFPMVAAGTGVGDIRLS